MKKNSLFVFICLLAFASNSFGNGKKGKRPNILFILADDLGYSDVGYMGLKDGITTPSIDKLASEGTVFTNAYASCPVCSPTRASILTGKSPAALQLTCHIPGMGMEKYIHKLSDGKPLMEARFIDRLPLEEITIAELLKEKGYRTGFFGKWHLAGEGSAKSEDGMVAPDFHPNKQGFDINIGGNAYGQPKKYFSPYGNGTLKNGADGEYLTDRLTNEAMKFMDTERENPFFCYLSYYTVHEPHQAPKDLIEKNNGNRHHAMISSLDKNVGRLLRFLEAKKLDKNTLVIFYSDNGGLQNNPPLRDKKGSLYEGGIRVPLVFKYPGKIPANQNSTPVYSPDFLPTIADFAGISIKNINGLEGENLMPELLGNATLKERPLFWHYPHHRNNKMSMAAAVREGDWKLIYEFELEKYSLFNLKEDISEQQNLVGIYQEKVKELKNKLESWQNEVDAVLPEKNRNYKVQ